MYSGSKERNQWHEFGETERKPVFQVTEIVLLFNFFLNSEEIVFSIALVIFGVISACKNKQKLDCITHLEVSTKANLQT